MATKKILVAEDDKPIASVMELKLKNAGFSVTLVGNGEEALNMLEKETFDMIMLDLIMPKKDGFLTLEEIKKRGIKTPVIVTSNLGQEEDVNRVTDLGASKYFIKSESTIAEIVNWAANELEK